MGRSKAALFRAPYANVMLHSVFSTMKLVFIFTIISFSPTTSAHDFHLKDPKRAFALFDEVLLYEELEATNQSKFNTELSVVFLLDRIPDWVSLMDADIDVRYTIMRMYSWLAQFSDRNTKRWHKEVSL